MNQAVISDSLARSGRQKGLLLALLCVLLAGGLLGCGSPLPASAMSGDLVTDSDEPLARKRAKIRLELATGYFNNGQTTIALDELKQSINADPSLPDAHNLRGLVYMRLNDFALAEESFRRALQLSPQSAGIQHNLAWLYCQQNRFTESFGLFSSAIAVPAYLDRSKSWMAMGVCQMKAGAPADALASLTRANELDPVNPVASYNLALLLLQRGELGKAQFHAKRINNSDYANAESLWLGIKIENQLGNKEAVAQLGGQLKKRFGPSKEAGLWERGALNE